MKVEDFQKLAEPFNPEDIEWRIARSGFSKKTGKPWAQVLAYLTSRAVQDRLDEVCGPDGWQSEIVKIDGAYLCKLSIRVDYDDGKQVWISKTDGSDETNVEAVKGAISGSLKRAAVLFKCGRYLYDLKNNFAVVSDNGKYTGEYKDDKGSKQYFNWDPPALPDWALPKNKKSAAKSTSTTAVDSPELTEAIKTVNDYISKGVIDKSWMTKVDLYLKNKDLEGLNKIINYYKEQAGADAAFSA